MRLCRVIVCRSFPIRVAYWIVDTILFPFKWSHSFALGYSEDFYFLSQMLMLRAHLGCSTLGVFGLAVLIGSLFSHFKSRCFARARIRLNKIPMQSSSSVALPPQYSHCMNIFLESEKIFILRLKTYLDLRGPKVHSFQFHLSNVTLLSFFFSTKSASASPWLARVPKTS